jgi:hypothetical protein
MLCIALSLEQLFRYFSSDPMLRTAPRLTFEIASYLFTVFRTAIETEWVIYWASHKEEHPCQGNSSQKLSNGNDQAAQR